MRYIKCQIMELNKIFKTSLLRVRDEFKYVLKFHMSGFQYTGCPEEIPLLIEFLVGIN